jgi:uncharacterized glyoxalase superfamily protein PhnB/mannose-6-phosphate isomerase-like protein (cupin superfamily)
MDRKAIVVAPDQGRRYAMGRIMASFLADTEETRDGYSISEWWLEPNTTGPGTHSHEEDDVFYVLEGTMSFLLEDRWLDAGRGSFLVAPGGMKHDFQNRSASRSGVLNFSVPGGFERDMPAIVDWFKEHPAGDALPTPPKPTPVPEGQRAFPSLIVRDAAEAIRFYCNAFGARENYRLEANGKIGHAEITFDGITVMLADAFPELGFPAPSGIPSIATVVYVADVDAFAARAVAAGAKLEQPAHDEFFGSRIAALLDPFNHRWLVHTRRELVTVDQMRARMPA